jgi:uncharacterized protein involved in exopolysaccharide biosynthesis
MVNRNLRARREESTHQNTARDFLAIGFRQRRLIVTTFVGLLAAVILIALLLPKQYESQMKILVRHERAESVVTVERESPQQLRTEVSEEELESEAELLKSKDLLSKVVVACDLQREAGNSLWASISSKVLRTSDSTLAAVADEKISRAVLVLEKNLDVRPIKLTNLISVSYKAADPHQAARVLNTISSLYLEKHLAMHRAPGVFDFFHQQAEEYRRALANSEARLANFGQREGVVSPTLTREITIHKLGEFEAAWQETQAAILETKQRIQTLQIQLSSLSPRHTTQVRTSDNPQLMERLKSALLELELKRSALLTRFEPTYRSVQEVDQQIAQAREAIVAAEKAPLRDETTDRDPTYEALRAELAKANTELGALQARATATSAMIRSYRAKSERLDHEEVLQQDMLRAAKANEENYLLYLRKQEEARISDALDRQRISNVLVAEAPTVPFKSQGRRLLFVILGTLFASIASVVTGLVVDYWDPSFRTPQEVQDFLGSPVLAALPKDGG